MKKAPANLKQEMDALDPKLTSVILPWILRHPRYLRAAARFMRAVKRAKLTRLRARENGLTVPPFLILSITSQCNLYCNGCFASAVGNIPNGNSKAKKRTKPQLNKEQWREIIGEARELGIIGFVIAGGEPFLFPGLIDLCEEFKDRLFLILTNGTALTKADYRRLKRLTNIAIIVSIEGGPELTNARRGEGVYEKAMSTLKEINKIGVPNGISVTVTRMNYQYWMKEENIDSLIKQGVRIGVFIEYIPLTPGSELGDSYIGLHEPLNKENEWNAKNDHALMLTKGERDIFRAKMIEYRETKPIYIIHSPGDEEFFGGCVSAGRGFAHVTPAGDLTPCPVSNIATHNLVDSSLRDALASDLFEEIRESEHLLETEGMPCALFAHPKEVEALAKFVGAYRTDLY